MSFFLFLSFLLFCFLVSLSLFRKFRIKKSVVVSALYEVPNLLPASQQRECIYMQTNVTYLALPTIREKWK